MSNLIVVGGGELVDAIRRSDAAHGLDQRVAHWLAIDAMSLSARLVAAILPDANLLTELPERLEAELSILDVHGFMRRDAEDADALPESWDVTSDSIAARVAQRINARELVLCKSALPVHNALGGLTLDELAAQGYVDRYLPTCAPAAIPVRCVNLRAESFAELAIAGSIPTAQARLDG
jgi:aspartokinase-like uncharacterized kinase